MSKQQEQSGDEFNKEGIAFFGAKQYQQAIQCFLQSLGKEKNDSVSYNLARAYQCDGQTMEAVSLYQALLKNPKLKEKAQCRLNECQLLPISKNFKPKRLFLIQQHELGHISDPNDAIMTFGLASCCALVMSNDNNQALLAHIDVFTSLDFISEEYRRLREASKDGKVSVNLCYQKDDVAKFVRPFLQSHAIEFSEKVLLASKSMVFFRGSLNFINQEEVNQFFNNNRAKPPFLGVNSVVYNGRDFQELVLNGKHLLINCMFMPDRFPPYVVAYHSQPSPKEIKLLEIAHRAIQRFMQDQLLPQIVNEQNYTQQMIASICRGYKQVLSVFDMKLPEPSRWSGQIASSGREVDSSLKR